MTMPPQDFFTTIFQLFGREYDHLITLGYQTKKGTLEQYLQKSENVLRKFGIFN